MNPTPVVFAPARFVAEAWALDNDVPPHTLLVVTRMDDVLALRGLGRGRAAIVLAAPGVPQHATYVQALHYAEAALGLVFTYEAA